MIIEYNAIIGNYYQNMFIFIFCLSIVVIVDNYLFFYYMDFLIMYIFLYLYFLKLAIWLNKANLKYPSNHKIHKPNSKNM
jgi:hypothetical protein